MRRKRVFVGLKAAFGAACFSSVIAFGSIEFVQAASLSKEAEARLMYSRVKGMEAASLAVATVPDEVGHVAQLVERLGGLVRYRFDEVDYLNVALPLDAVPEFAVHPSVYAITVDQPDEDYTYAAGWYSLYASEEAGVWQSPSERDDEIVATSGSQETSDWPPKPSSRPITHPYSILRDMDGYNLREMRPSYDGRGTVIAHVEWWPDFLSPELQVAYDVQGNRIPKFADVINIPVYPPSLDEDAERADPASEWFELSAAVTGQDSAEFDGREYRLPDPGTYRLGEFVFPEKMGYTRSAVFDVLSKAYAPEERKDGDDEIKVIARSFAWSENDKTLRIDLDNDGDFSNDVAVGVYANTQEFGILGKDDPETEARETIGYAVQKDGDYIGIMLGVGSHATLVAGAAVASRGDNGRIDGVAPGAQLLPVSIGTPGTRATAFGQALTVAFSDPRTDVILVEGSFPTTSLHNLKDGTSTGAVLLQRLVEHYKKPAFFTAFNMPGMSTASDTGHGPDVISVGAHQSAAAVFANFGIKTRYQDDLHFVGSEGPAGDGAIKPDFLAPAIPMTTTVGYVDRGTRLRLGGILDFPIGYAIGGGTSVATPVASGAAAMLVSAAKQEGITWDAGLINKALRSTAKFLPPFPAYKQGRGVIQIEAAWRWIEATHSGVVPVDIEVAAPVRTVTSHLLATPHLGRGLFEREGWRVGDKGERSIMLTRTSGPDRDMVFDVEWAGNDHETFSSTKRIRLPLNQAKRFDVKIHPTETGDHSAIAVLRHEGTSAVAAHVPATIVVPYEFDAEGRYAQDLKIALDRPGRKNLFFRVPEGVEALNVFFTHDREQLLAKLTSPATERVEHFIIRDANDKDGISIALPSAGVWQVTFSEKGDSAEYDWSARGQDVLPSVNVRLRVSVSGVSVSTPSVTSAGDMTIGFTNDFDTFTGAASGAIGAMREEQGELRYGERQVVDLEVEDGASLLIAEVAGSGREAADFDLYLYDCTGTACTPARYGVSYNGRERVLVQNPSPGAWKAIVALHGVSSDAVSFTYRDIYIHPRFGGFHLTDEKAERQTGEKWSARGHIWLAERPDAVRTPIGVVWLADPQRRQPHRPIQRPAGNWWSDLPHTSDFVPLGLRYLAVGE